MITALIMTDKELFMLDGMGEKQLRTDVVLSEIERATEGLDRLEYLNFSGRFHGSRRKSAAVLSKLCQAGFVILSSTEHGFYMERRRISG